MMYLDNEGIVGFRANLLLIGLLESIQYISGEGKRTVGFSALTLASYIKP